MVRSPARELVGHSMGSAARRLDFVERKAHSVVLAGMSINFLSRDSSC
jgi:hypothetical protein